jgi:amidase
MRFPEYNQHDALGLAQLVRTGQITASELCEAAIERLEKVNPQTNAVVTRAFDRARSFAADPLPDGPFAGVPFLLKDLGAPWAGVRLTNGSRFFEHYVPDMDGTLVQRLRAAGLNFLGRTASPELGLVPFTEPELHKPVCTPWKAGFIAGGSSGGSAAAVASGVVPMAHGGDGGGSIRMPASCCGLFGLKPSRGRTPIGPLISESWYGFVAEHAITRSVRDSAALLDATLGPEPTGLFSIEAPASSYLQACQQDPRPLRVGITALPHMPGTLHPDCRAALDDAAKLVESLGHTIVPVELGISKMEFANDFFTSVAVALTAEIDMSSRLLGKTAGSGDFEADTWVVNLIGRQTSARRFMKARQNLQALTRATTRQFENIDVLLTPTLALPPPPIGSLRPHGFEGFMQKVIAKLGLGVLLRVPGVVEKSVAEVFKFMPFTPLANVTGQPSMSVPLFWNDDGLPIGTMFTARLGDEATLFALAGQLERARPWADKRPPIHADA